MRNSDSHVQFNATSRSRWTRLPLERSKVGFATLGATSHLSTLHSVARESLYPWNYNLSPLNLSGSLLYRQSQTRSFTFFVTSPSWLGPLVAQRSKCVTRSREYQVVHSWTVSLVLVEKNRAKRRGGQCSFVPST
jgi:hypothetical protein